MTARISAPAARMLWRPRARRQPRVSATTMASRTGCPRRTAASRRSTTHVRWVSGKRARRAAATGSVWTTSPSDESLTSVIRRGSPAMGAESLEDRADEIAAGVGLRIADDGDRSARAAHRGSLGNRVRGVVGALGVYVGSDGGGQSVGGVLVEDDHVVDVGQGGQQLHTLDGRDEWSAGALETGYRGIGIHPDEQHVAQAPGGPKIADMADVEQVEASVGEDDSLAIRAEPLGQRGGFARGHGALRARAWPSSAGDTVAVPRFITTMPPATLASVAACTGVAPAASASVKVLMTVSPAPVTSAISSVP